MLPAWDRDTHNLWVHSIGYFPLSINIVKKCLYKNKITINNKLTFRLINQLDSTTVDNHIKQKKILYYSAYKLNTHNIPTYIIL